MEKGKNKYVLDTSVFLHSFFVPESGYTVPGVLQELKSEKKYVLESLLEDGKIVLKEPGDKSVRTVRKIASKLGEEGKLSETDVQLLALALELNATLLTDDFHMQNVARVLGIKYSGIFEIKEGRKWVLKCSKCGRKLKTRICPYCGGKGVYSSKLL